MSIGSVELSLVIYYVGMEYIDICIEDNMFIYRRLCTSYSTFYNKLAQH